jgi:U3 small nucleolar RNA-associated protein 14
VTSNKLPSKLIQDDQPRTALDEFQQAPLAEKARGTPEGEQSTADEERFEVSKEALLAAFAGDDVAAEFEKDKAEAIQETAGAVAEPTSLPGWGVWASSKHEPRCDPYPPHAASAIALLTSSVLSL